MLKIICNSMTEKRDLLEASELLHKLKLDSKNPMVNFLTNLSRNPGAIEVMDELRVIQRPVSSSSKHYKKFTKWGKEV